VISKLRAGKKVYLILVATSEGNLIEMRSRFSGRNNTYFTTTYSIQDRLGNLCTSQQRASFLNKL